MFLVYVVNFGLSVYALVFGLIRLDVGRLRTAFNPHAPTRLVAVSLVGMGLIMGLLWLSQDVLALLAGQVPSDVTDAGLLTNPIHGLENYKQMLHDLTEDHSAIKVYVEVARNGATS